MTKTIKFRSPSSDDTVDEMEILPQNDSGSGEVTITVRLGHDKAIAGCYLVYQPETAEAWLVNEGSVQPTYADQEIPLSVLNQSAKPYDWDDEIDQLVVPRQRLRLALWQAGHVSKKPLAVREIVSSFLTRGVLPVK